MRNYERLCGLESGFITLGIFTRLLPLLFRNSPRMRCLAFSTFETPFSSRAMSSRDNPLFSRQANSKQNSRQKSSAKS